MYTRFFILMILLLTSKLASANWTLNLGYHNPPNSRYGINFLYFGAKFGFELGIGTGSIDAGTTEDDGDDEDDSVFVNAGGAISVKWFLSKGTLTPYLQGGMGTSSSVSAGENSGAGANIGGPFLGIGILIGSPSLYVYGSFNIRDNSNFIQAGLGFDI